MLEKLFLESILLKGNKKNIYKHFIGNIFTLTIVLMATVEFMMIGFLWNIRAVEKNRNLHRLKTFYSIGLNVKEEYLHYHKNTFLVAVLDFSSYETIPFYHFLSLSSFYFIYLFIYLFIFILYIYLLTFYLFITFCLHFHKLMSISCNSFDFVSFSP